MSHPNEIITALQPYNGYSVPPATSGDVNEIHSAGQSGVLRVWLLIKRSRQALALGVIAGTVIGLLLAILQTPVFQARSSLEIQTVNENFLNLADVSQTTVNSGNTVSDVQTQAKILESRALLDRVAAGLAVRFPGDAPTGAIRKAYEWIVPRAHSDFQRKSLVSLAADETKVKTFINSRVVDISCDSSNAELARAFVTAWGAEYSRTTMEGHWDTIQRTETFLTDQIAEMRRGLEKSEDQLQNYAVSAGLLFTGDKDSRGNVAEDSLRHAQEELSKAQAERMRLQSLYEMTRTTPTESLPEMLSDKSLADAGQKLSDLKRQLAEDSSTLTPAHYKVQRTQAQIAELEGTVKQLRQQILVRMNSEFQAAQRREQLLLNAYETQFRTASNLDSRAVHYNVLKREVDTSRQLYESMLKQVKEAGIASAIRSGGVRVVDEATLPLAPYKPQKLIFGSLGSMGGLIFGLVLAVTGDSLRRKVRKPGEAERWLEVPELGVIPEIRRNRIAWRNQRVLHAAEQMDDTSSPSMITLGYELREWGGQFSAVAEAFRAALTSINFVGGANERPRVIVVSSPQPSEGKTTVSINLAMAFAESNRRVLLIDADMRRPRIHDCFGLSDEYGLVDLLQFPSALSSAPLEALCSSTATPGLFVLPAGTPGGAGAPLLYSARLPELIARFRNEFDMVLIDTPPMLHLADARIVGQLADAFILVLAANQTTRESAVAAKQTLDKEHISLLGTIVNGVEVSSDSSYYRAYTAYKVET